MSTADTSSISANRSALREFLASIATIRGDLSNITAPPFVLADKSTVEFPQYWAENPSIFLAPAFEPDPQKRALLVLKWFLSSLKSQQYAGRSPEDGVKKPLNAFLGELFLGQWDDENGVTRLVSEQVSHHPPVTACILWNDEAGVQAEGYTRQSIGFNGSVTIHQYGHAILTLNKLPPPNNNVDTASNNHTSSHSSNSNPNPSQPNSESYLIPLPSVKVKNILTGHPYPELSGSYKITSTSGYTSEMDFTGKSFLGAGTKNSVSAKLYREEDGPGKPLYRVEGSWSGKMVFHACQTKGDSHGHPHSRSLSSASKNGNEDEIIETYDANAPDSRRREVSVAPLAEQDTWESRKAWADVISALRRGDMQGTSDAKSKIERAQRGMRKDEESKGKGDWERCFFTRTERDERFADLAKRAGFSEAEVAEEVKQTQGVWKISWESIHGKRRPYRGEEVTPYGYQEQVNPGGATGDGVNGGRKEVVQGNSVQNGSLGPGEGAPEAREASTSNVDSPVTKSTTQDTMGEDLEQYQTAQSSNHDPPSTTDSIRSNGISTPDQTVD